MPTWTCHSATMYSLLAHLKRRHQIVGTFLTLVPQNPSIRFSTGLAQKNSRGHKVDPNIPTEVLSTCLVDVWLWWRSIFVQDLNKLLYRAKQRGFLELDILIGTWAECNLSSRSQGFWAEFSEILDEENPELFRWLTCQEQPPPRMTRNRAFVSLQAYTSSLMRRKCDRETRALKGHHWVRGWDDPVWKMYWFFLN